MFRPGVKSSLSTAPSYPRKRVSTGVGNVGLTKTEHLWRLGLTSYISTLTAVSDSKTFSWETDCMASTEDLIRKLLAENLEVDRKPLPQPVDFSLGLTEIGVSSMDIAAFAKVVAQEFDVSFTNEICAELDNLNDLVKCLDGQMA